MADENKDENKSPEELETAQRNSERAKVSLPESIILISLASIADLLEFVAILIIAVPVVGQINWFLAFGFGLFVSFILILWSFLRGVHGLFIVKRTIILIIGALADAATLGFMPIRTITLIIVIWLNNHVEGKNLQRILALLSKIK